MSAKSVVKVDVLEGVEPIALPEPQGVAEPEPEPAVKVKQLTTLVRVGRNFNHTVVTKRVHPETGALVTYPYKGEGEIVVARADADFVISLGGWKRK